MDPLTELFLVEPEEFVAARDALAKRLRAAGDADAAAAVKSLRRPTLSVWLLNVVAHDSPDVVSRVREVGAELRTAQAEAIRTREGAAMRALATTRRRVVDDTVRAAVEVAGVRGRDLSAAHRDSLAETVAAALADDELAGEWAAGRLREARDAAGFNFGDAVVAAGSTASARRARPQKAARDAAPPAAAPKRVSSGVRRSRPDAAEGRERVAADRAAQLRREAEVARRAVDAARAEWAEADRAAKVAKQRLRDAERAASRADLFAATAEQAAWEAGERSRR